MQFEAVDKTAGGLLLQEIPELESREENYGENEIK